MQNRGDAITRFQLGQIWTFLLSKDTPTNAALKILRVDIDPKEGAIVFIHVIGAQTHTWDQNLYYLSGDALNRSVVKLTETNSALTIEEQKNFSNYYDTYQRGVLTKTFSKSSDSTVAEFVEHDAKN